jgi:hypothetical protein
MHSFNIERWGEGDKGAKGKKRRERKTVKDKDTEKNMRCF